MTQKKLSISKSSKGTIKLHTKKGSDKGPTEEEVEVVPWEDQGKGKKSKPSKKKTKKGTDAQKGADKKKKTKVKKGKKAHATSTISKNEKEVSVDEEEFVVNCDSEDMANVGFSISRSFNLGNYENLKANISINIPSNPNVKDMNDSYGFAREWVEGKLQQVIEDYDLET